MKWGGSLVTRPCGDGGAVRADVVSRLSRELLQTGFRGVVVHGTGHVGKPPARRYGYLETGFLDAGRADVALGIARQIEGLRADVLQAAGAAGLNLQAARAADFFGGRPWEVRPGGAARLVDWIAQGRTPAFCGEFAALPDGCFRVFSSDEMVTLLARTLRPRRVVFLTDAAGVYAPDGRTLAVIRSGDLAALRWGDGDRTDVSGGMQAKVRCALQAAAYCGSCWIADGRVPGAMRAVRESGAPGGTRVVPEVTPRDGA